VKRDLDPPPGIVREVVARALAEDLGQLGDLTSIAVVDEDALASARFVSRADGVIAGIAAATETFHQVDRTVGVEWSVSDGDEIQEGQELGRVSGSLRAILGAERTALNLLQHCSGVATLTRRFVRAAHGKARIRDTRKTLPGLRALEKAAVRAGGGFNHRECMSDAILIKDNHLRHVDVRRAVDRARARWPGRIVEVECDTMEQVADVLAARADLILLDNMSPAEAEEACRKVDGQIPVEISGRIGLDAVGAYAQTGVDFISVGAITHSAPALDIGLDLD
jgi:nicotinate-nucleotide pyrophosphorylase (carboxylating)